MIFYFGVTTFQPTRSSHGQPTPPSSTVTWWPDPSHHSSAPTPLLPWLASSRTQRSATGTWWRSAASFWCPSLLAYGSNSDHQEAQVNLHAKIFTQKEKNLKYTSLCHVSKQNLKFPMILITIQGRSRSLPIQAGPPDCLWHPSWCLQQAQQQLWAARAIHSFARICQTGVR